LLGWAAPVVALLALIAAMLPGTAGAATPVSVEFMPGFAAPETPETLNKVGVIKIGQPTARNVLVLEPGTSAAGAYFVPFAKWVAETLPSWQVWAVVRRQSLLEDQSKLNLAKEGKATPEEVFNFYIGWLNNPALEHFQPAGEPAYARHWGMKVAVEDLHHVIEAAHKLGGAVVLGGHSLGGSVVTAYATWNFGGTPGANGLAGLVYDDGGSSPVPVAEATAKEEVAKLETESPWLSFGGIRAPFAGIFVVLGAAATQIAPNEPSLAFNSPLVNSSLKPPKPPCNSATNEAEFGFGTDVGTAPETLVAAQAHVGKLVEPSVGEGLCTWSGEGALTPIHRFAEMFDGEGLIGQDGSEWYFPHRLTIDTGAVAEGNANPAQSVLEVEATQGHNLPKNLKILAIDSELDKKVGHPRGSLISAEVLAEQSGIPKENLTLIEAQETYAHNDPAGAFPKNVFFEALIPYLQALGIEKAELKNWVVSGSITDKKQGQPITLPAGSTFNGTGEVNLQTGAGSVEGNLFFPPFNSTLNFFGLIPTTLGLTLTETAPITGTVTEAEAGKETLTLPVKLNMGITSFKVFGLTIPAQCTTAEPIALNLVTTLSREELLSKGWSFTGSTTLPRFKCEGGLLGSLLSFVFSSSISGSENPYAIKVTAPGG
jgi:pimeloyl-ACP methyl ester carboxylesterase